MSTDPPCTEDPVLFFSNAAEDQTLAKKHCNACPIRDDCLDLAMSAEGTSRERYGVFGALTGEERVRLHRRTARQYYQLKEKQHEQQAPEGT